MLLLLLLLCMGNLMERGGKLFCFVETILEGDVSGVAAAAACVLEEASMTRLPVVVHQRSMNGR